MDTSCAARNEVKSATRGRWGSLRPPPPRRAHTAVAAPPSEGGCALGCFGTRCGSAGRAGRRGGRKRGGSRLALAGAGTRCCPPTPPGPVRPSPVRTGPAQPGAERPPPALAPSLRAGRRAPANPAEPGWAAREASPPQPPPPPARAEAPRPLPGSTPGTAAPRRPRSSTRASLSAARPGLSRRCSAAEDTSWEINKLITPLALAAGREAGGGRGIRSGPS